MKKLPVTVLSGFLGAGKTTLVEQILHKLNPGTKLIKSIMGRVDPAEILNTGLFNFEEAESSAVWIKELNSGHVPETEEYGISSFVFRARKPFHPDRFLHYASQNFPASIIRSKGLFWLASRPDHAILWSQAGGSLKAELYGRWWAAVPPDEKAQNPEYYEMQQSIAEKWDNIWGDRSNEIVIIGQDLDKARITEELESCLINSEEEALYEAAINFNDNWPL